MRTKLRKTLEDHSMTEDTQVKFMVPKLDLESETDEDVLNRLAECKV